MTRFLPARLPYLLSASLLLLLSSAGAQDKLLPPTYQAGKSYQMEMEQTIEMDMSAMGQAGGQEIGKMTTSMIMGMSIACEKHDVADQRALTTSFDKIIMDMDMGPMKMSIDSTDPESMSSPMAMGVKPLLEMEIVTILDENDEIVDVQGIDGIAGVQGMDLDQIKQMSDPAAQLGIPDSGVSVGEKWEHEMEVPMGQQMGKAAIKMNLEYIEDEEVDGKTLAVIEFTGSLNTEMQEEGAGPMEMDKADMKGQMRFDKANRVLKDGNTTGEFELSMPNPAGGEGITVPMELEQKFQMDEVGN